MMLWQVQIVFFFPIKHCQPNSKQKIESATLRNTETNSFSEKEYQIIQRKFFQEF